MGEGLVEVTGDRVAILTDMAIAAENIDEAKAEEARQQAAARLRAEAVCRASRFRQCRVGSLTGAIRRQATPTQVIEVT